MSDLGNKQIMADNITHYMSVKGIDRTELCKALDFKYSTVSEWLVGKKYPRIDSIEKMANFFEISKSDLIEKRVSPPFDIFTCNNIKTVKLKKFPLLGEIACGEPIFADEQKESYVMADMDIDADFCLIAKGDSMINARIVNGDIVFISQMPMVANGDIAAVIIDNEATLKRVYYYPEKNLLILKPENPSFHDLIYTDSELNDIRILGKAVYFMSAL